MERLILRKAFWSFVCLTSFAASAGTVALAIRSHRTSDTATWRVDPRAEADGSHASLRSVWREYRTGTKPPPARPREWTGDVALLETTNPPILRYRTLSLANGRVEYQEYGLAAPSPFM